MVEVSKEEIQNMVLDGVPAIRTLSEVEEAIEKIATVLDKSFEPDSESMTNNWKYALATVALWRILMHDISSSNPRQIDTASLTIAFILGRLRQARPEDLVTLKADLIERFGKLTMDEMLPK